jgi:putative integral membrane protein (TIGR02587 family)
MAATPREFAEGIGRAFAGALLFSLPILMTMEMWWLGFYMAPWRLILLVAAFFPILVALSHFVGFDETAGLPHDIVHATVAYGVAFTCSAAILAVLAILRPGMGTRELTGKALLQSVPAALGALLAQAHFGSPPEKEQRRREASYLSHLFFIVVGALYVAMTVAPTDEMVLIAARMTDAHAIVAAIVSLALLHVFVYGAGFAGHPVSADAPNALRPFLRLTVVGYALSLGVSAFLLWIFGRFENESIVPIVHGTVVLGLPAALGAAAARLTLDTE